jgi:uncharacterized protein YjcR
VSAYATLADICRVYRVSERTARRWAAADGWRRVASKPARYSLADVQASYDSRYGRRVQRHLERKYADLLPDAPCQEAGGCGSIPVIF